MEQKFSLTEGSILGTLMRFAIPIFFTLFLQALYGGVDLLVVGQFAETADVSGVATGSLLLSTITMIITGLSMGITILVGERIGKRQPREAGEAIGSGICLFAVFAAALTVFMTAGAEQLAGLMHAPEEAFLKTVHYIQICGAGSVFIVSYNVLGATFRGIGDSKTPLITVLIACIINIAGDLLLVAGFHMGAAGAATATVLAQASSVVISLFLLRRRKLPFVLTRREIRFNRKIIFTELRLGFPVALQELFVGASFLFIQTIVNSLGVVASAGVGVAEKVCAFIMLLPSAYMQSMSAFIAQNMGAGNETRARKALRYSIYTAIAAGLCISLLTVLFGDYMSALFTKDVLVIEAAHSYLQAYAVDCLLTPVLFCMIGYYNGCEKTLFVMLQGVIGAFCVRIPVVWLISRIEGVSLFEIGLGTPASSLVQILLCVWFYRYLRKSGLKPHASHA